MTERLHFHTVEKEMATHSSVLAWRIPGMGEPGGLPSLGSRRVGHDWSDLVVVMPFLLNSLSISCTFFFKNKLYLCQVFAVARGAFDLHRALQELQLGL